MKRAINMPMSAANESEEPSLLGFQMKIKKKQQIATAE